MGVTGQVYNSGEIVSSNMISRLAAYQPSIDNRADEKNVRNIMIVPIYGHRAKMVSNGKGV